MGDIKSVWDSAPVPIPDLGGQGVLDRGTDPLIDTGGTSALKEFWPDEKRIVADPTGDESANSVSGLPARPARWEPAVDTVEIPSLQDRNPGTIDKR